MALDQHAEALSELLQRFRTPMQQIREIAPEVAANVPPLSQPVPPVAETAPDTRDFEMKRGPAPEPTPIEHPENLNDDGAGRIYEIDELGGREIEAAAGDSKGRVYDLDEFGAVEL